VLAFRAQASGAYTPGPRYSNSQMPIEEGTGRVTCPHPLLLALSTYEFTCLALARGRSPSARTCSRWMLQLGA